jgi:hypothetical protein
LSKTSAIRKGRALPPRRNGIRTLEKEYESEGWGTASLLIIRCFAGAVGVEEALQNQHGSHLIDNLTMAGKGASGGVEVTVGFSRGEALVPEVDGEGECLAEGFGKGVGFGRLGADVARHIEGVAEDDGRAAEFAEQAAEGFEVLPGVFADQGEDGLSGKAKLVGDGNADAAVSGIEAQEAGLHSSDGNAGGERKPHLRMG